MVSGAPKAEKIGERSIKSYFLGIKILSMGTP